VGVLVCGALLPRFVRYDARRLLPEREPSVAPPATAS
jgi:hypothetical protein